MIKIKFKVYILLQYFDGYFGKFYKFIQGGQYNHASIAMNESMDEFYSFRSKWGFCVEHPFRFNKQHKKHIKFCIYELEVSKQEYIQMLDEIEFYKNNRKHFKYSYISLVLGFLGIKHRFKYRSYCSRFIAEILSKSKKYQRKKDESLVMPCDLIQKATKLHYEGIAHDYVKYKL